MQYRAFSIPATGSPDLEEELNRFLRAHRVISVQKALETVGDTPRWCFCVEYLEGAPGPSRGRGGRRGAERVDYKEVLSEEDFAVFARLRDRRKELAMTEAIPVYAVCTNEQLAAMATGRPASLSDLRKIEGLGEAKAGKYGEALLAALHEGTSEPNEASGQPD